MSLNAQQKTDPAVRIGNNDLGCVVRSVTGPEAGIWVIAETTGLPTPLAVADPSYARHPAYFAS
jgi:hypothetical protein